MTPSRPPTLLVLRHHGLGDLVTVQPALRALRLHFPGHRLIATCPSWLIKLAEHFGTADAFVSELPGDATAGQEPADPSRHQVVDTGLLDNVLRQVSTVDVLVSLRTPGPELTRLYTALRPRLLISYRYAELQASVVYPNLDFADHILTRWRRLLGCAGIAVRDDDLHRETPPSALNGFTVVHVGAGSPARLWPVERWAAVVRHLEERRHLVMLTGSRAEEAIVDAVRRAAGLPEKRDRSGRGDILELARLVAGSRLVLSVDTGISHLATAYQRPAVTLFGPVPPAWWGPPPGNPQHRTIWRGRLGDNYGSVPDPGLLDISVDDVIAGIEQLCGAGFGGEAPRVRRDSHPGATAPHTYEPSSGCS